MARQLWMADVLRAAGLPVVEVPGWQSRGLKDKDGNDLAFEPEGLMTHETQGSWTSTDKGEINVMINGRAGLTGPIAHLYLSKTATWHVVTAGKSNHVKTGWAGPFAGLGNTHLLGIEAQHGAGEPWTDLQYQSYVRGVAAILTHTGWAVAGHKEHQPGDKSDPGFDMNQFRADVAATGLPTTKGNSDMLLIKTADDATVYISHAGAYRPMTSEAAFNAAVSAGHRMVTVATMAELEDLAGRPAGEPAPAPPVDVSALAEALAPHMASAAEAAVRKVLGAVDGATPATS